jgi:hypothetical protein
MQSASEQILAANSQNPHSPVGIGCTTSGVPGSIGQFATSISLGHVCAAHTISCVLIVNREALVRWPNITGSAQTCLILQGETVVHQET